MRLIPRSLTARTVLLLIGTVLLSEVATFGALHAYRRAVVASQRAELVADYARAMATALAALSPPERSELARATGSGRGIRLVRATDVSAPRPGPMTPRAEAFAAGIRALLGPDTAVIAPAGGERALWIGIEATGEPWWVVLPTGRVEGRMHWARLTAIAGVIGAVLALSWLYVWSIARPLRDIARATRSVGAGQPCRLIPQGPQELRTLAQQFNHMVDELERNERERRVMLAGLPHDLRAPLTRVRLRLALLEDEDARAGLARDAEEIERIATQFVSYLRGHEAETLAPVMLPELLQEIAEPYLRLGRDIRVDAPAELAAEIYPASMKRLLENLVDNAVRYGAEPVEITAAARDGELWLEVRDHGPGIPEAQRAQALEPFVRLDAARSGSGSCGLGLAIVERVARLHGGRVDLDAARGGGLLVRVRIPARIPSAGRDVSCRNPAAAPSA